MPARRRPDAFSFAVWGVGLAMAGLCAWRSAVWSWGADTGTFYQVILHAFAGFGDGPEDGSHLRFHWSPVLALLWPLVRAIPDVLPLQLVQVAAIVGTAPVLRALVRPYVGERLATLAGVVTLLYPPLLAIAFEEFHELGFWPLLAVTMLWAADRRRWRTFALAVAAAVTLREDVALIVAIVGAALIAAARWRRDGATGMLDGGARDRRALTLAGAGAIAAAALSLAIYYGAVVPRVGGWAPSHFYDYGFAHGPVQALLAVVTRPLDVWHVVGTRGRATYLLEALLPTLGTWLFSRWSLLAVPGFAVCLLATEEVAWRMGGHYVALWAPFLLVGSALGARRLGRPAATLRASAIVCALWLVVANPMHPAHYLRPQYPDLAAARAALACVPAGASVSTHDDWYSAIVPHVPGATIERDDRAWLVYADDYDNAHFRDVLRPAVARAVAAGRYAVACRTRAVAAYRRVGDAAPGTPVP